MDSDGYAWETIWDVLSLFLSITEVAASPGDLYAWLGLLGDVADCLIPFVGGMGETIRALRLADGFSDKLGDLSKAAEYGVKAYNELKKLLKGTGLQAHHIIEQRLVKHLGIDVYRMLSVAVTPAEHQKFTNMWREIFKYGTNYRKLTIDDIWRAAQKVYKDYPALLASAWEILYGGK